MAAGGLQASNVVSVTVKARGLTDRRGTIGELLTALTLFFVGCGGIYLSLELDRPGEWFTAPGIVPLFLSSGVAAMAGLLVIAALRRGALSSDSIQRLHDLDTRVAANFAAAAGATAVFYFIVLRFLPFEVACFLFLLFMFHLFWRSGGVWRHMLAATIVTVSLVMAFQLLFDIPFPGSNNLLEAIIFHFRFR